jgi:hypothetical protein
MKNQKWTKINVHFQNFQNRFEKHYIIHFSVRSLSIFGELYIFVKGLKSRMGGLAERPLMRNSRP